MNSELIERIDFCLSHITLGLTVTHILEECKAALTQQQEAEPVAWVDEEGRVVRVSEDGSGDGGWVSGHDRAIPDSWTPLHPPMPAAQPQDADFLVPEDTAHLIYYDDSDRPLEVFYGHGARDGARARYERIYDNWNAHLFVCVDHNSLDDASPVAKLAQPQVPEGWDAEAYKSACDGLEYWKKRAEESELALERIRHDLSPTHMGEPVVPQWAGWACQCPGKLPRLYGAREVAEVNCDRENGDTLIYLQSSAAQQQVPESCEWELDDDESGRWTGSCGADWVFYDGGPTENRMNYCPSCGNTLCISAAKEEGK